MDSILCVVPWQSLTYHVIPEEFVAVNLTLFDYLEQFERFVTVCSVSGPTKSSKVERIVVKPAFEWGLGQLFLPLSMRIFWRKGCSTTKHSSWSRQLKVPCMLHRSTCLKRRNVWHRNLHRIAWPWEAECPHSPQHGRFNDSVSQPFLVRSSYAMSMNCPVGGLALYSLSVMVVILGILANTETTWTGNLET